MHNHPSLRKRFFSKWFVAVLSFSCSLVVLTIYQNSERHQISKAQELRKFAFMRNHKCASTTIENIIFRFAHKNQLNVVLPKSGNYLSTTELFNHSSLDATKWKNVEFDIFCLHNRWNKKEVTTLLREDVPAFTIVRDPVQVFESMFHFLDPRLHKFYGVKDIHDMIRIIQSRSPLTHQALSRRLDGMIGRNQMAWDLGLSPGIFDDEISITNEIERLDREFDLVMVANRMEESLVLLKQLLNWPLENVVHLNLNRRKPEKSSVLSADERKVLSDWLAADVRIYEHFSRRFDERVAEFNRKHSTIPTFFAGLFEVDSPMEREKQLLEEASKKLYGTCVVQELGNEKLSGIFKEYNNNIMGFDVNKNHQWCAFYAMSEPAYLKIFQDILLSRAINHCIFDIRPRLKRNLQCLPISQNFYFNGRFLYKVKCQSVGSHCAMRLRSTGLSSLTQKMHMCHSFGNHTEMCSRRQNSHIRPRASYIRDVQDSTPQGCRKFAFLKNHKCASSTIENIIFRFAHKNELNVVLPKSGNYLSRTQLFDHSSLNTTKWKNVEFDIFCLHSRWKKKEVTALLREEVPAFTIVRDPVQVFESMFHYLQPQFGKFYGAGDIHEMVIIIQNGSSPLLNKRAGKLFGRNQMAWDMGLSPEIFDDEISVTKEIERLDREFDLVMVANRMEESLVLLKQLLNWPLENVVHLNLNRRKPEKSSVLSVEERKVLSDWLAADVQIFEHFSRRFDERVAEFNRKHSTLSTFFLGFSEVDSAMKREKQLLEEANKQVYDACVVQELGNEKLKGAFKEFNNNIMGFVVNKKHEWCALYAMKEHAYLKIFRDLLLSRTMKQ